MRTKLDIYVFFSLVRHY